MKNFVELEAYLVRNKINQSRLALVCADEINALEAIADVEGRGYIKPVLIGDEEKIKGLIESNKLIANYEIIDEKDPKEAAKIAVSMAKNGEVDLIMKGLIQTSDLLSAVVKRDTGIREQKVLSHVALVEIPFKDKMYIMSDGGMLPYPNFEQKIGIIDNSISLARSLGMKEPKVALLDAAEHTNPHIQSSVDSEKLSLMNWGQAIVEGPISLDLAVSKQAAEIKQWDGQIQGDADILITPDIISGNILGKVGTLFTNGKMAGVIQGTKVPIILTSRGSEREEKINSILLACLIAGEE
ncbi:phosphate acyltransferase [Erysipelothrix urinaevulpis]|uniref:phosphate acyltransferase n=1 Tax=Erysipelothrix urinaevulpis TaxID=2683717 RepID=UPI00135680EA|nr:phosphate acyltransferase [Erysipelothrix urinaevulpis]